MPDLVSMRRVPAVRLEQGDGIGIDIVEAARVVQELADGDAGNERRTVPVEVEQALVDEPEDERRHEELRDAADSKRWPGVSASPVPTFATPAAASIRRAV